MYITVYIVFLGGICGALAQHDPLCEGCVFVNGAAYNKHADCTKFVQCHYNADGYLLGDVRDCPFATYWDMNLLTCRPADDTYCEVDTCAGKAEGHKREATTNCRGYWQCSSDLKSVPVCCGYNQYYDETLGCVEDVDNVCNDSCFSVIGTPNEPYTCQYTPVQGYPDQYQQYIEGWGWVTLPCPAGTLFDPLTCGCNINTQTFTQKDDECLPEIHLSFDKDHTDQSRYPSSVVNENVTVEDGKAVFNGYNSRLIIPRFTNLGSWIDTVVIRVNYTSPHKHFTGMARALVVNSDCGNLPSIMLAEDNSYTYFGVGTNIKKFVYTYVPQLPVNPLIPIDEQPKLEKYAEYKFAKSSLTGSNGVEEKSEQAPGFLLNVRCALQIGYADSMLPFEGEINDLKIYFCDPDE